VLVGAMAVLIATSLSACTSASSPTSNPGAPSSGIYTDAPAGQPHYFVALTNDGDGSVHGAMDYVYEDGQTSTVFTLQGTEVPLHQGSRAGVLTLLPTRIPQNGSASQAPKSVPAAISVTFDGRYLNFGECCSYLHFISVMTACQFSLLKGNEI